MSTNRPSLAGKPVKSRNKVAVTEVVAKLESICSKMYYICLPSKSSNKLAYAGQII